jgi:hypothetical protein
MVETLKDSVEDIAVVIGYVTTVTGFLALLIKPVREWFGNHIRKVSRTDDHEKRFDEVSAKIDDLIEVISSYISSNDDFKSVMMESIEILKDGSAITLGNAIKEIYNCYRDTKKIPEKEFEIVKRMYDIYFNELHNNSVIEYIHDEMNTWEVVID